MRAVRTMSKIIRRTSEGRHFEAISLDKRKSRFAADLLTAPVLIHQPNANSPSLSHAHSKINLSNVDFIDGEEIEEEFEIDLISYGKAKALYAFERKCARTTGIPIQNF